MASNMKDRSGYTSWLWLVLLGLVALSIPLPFYEPIHKTFVFEVSGVIGAAVSLVCVVGLYGEKRWALWVSVVRFLLGLVISWVQINDAVDQWAGTWAALARTR